MNSDKSNSKVEKLNHIEKILMDFFNQIKLCICIEPDNELEQITVKNTISTKTDDDYLLNDDEYLPKPKIITLSKKPNNTLNTNNYSTTPKVGNDITKHNNIAKINSDIKTLDLEKKMIDDDWIHLDYEI